VARFTVAPLCASITKLVSTSPRHSLPEYINNTNTHSKKEKSLVRKRGQLPLFFWDVYNRFQDFRESWSDFRDFKDFRTDFRDSRNFKDFENIKCSLGFRPDFKEFRSGFTGVSDLKSGFIYFKPDFVDFRSNIKVSRQDSRKFLSDFKDFRDFTPDIRYLRYFR